MTDDPQAPRRKERQSFEAEVGIRRSGLQPFRVRLFDGSTDGCKVEFIERPAVEERVWIKFDGLEALEGTVSWVEGHIGGVRFAHPLHEAVFRRLTGASKK
jgi:hypothetical protein